MFSTINKSGVGFWISFFHHFLYITFATTAMGQAASITFSNKSNILYDIDDFSSRFKKATMSTISVPMVIVAFPILNAYKFSEHEYTGVKMVDSTIGGLLGVVGCKFTSPSTHRYTRYSSLAQQGRCLLSSHFGLPIKPSLQKDPTSRSRYLRRPN